VLSAQSLGNFGCQTAQSLAFSINEQPLLVGVLLIDGAGFVAQSGRRRNTSVIRVTPVVSESARRLSN
jgi:hypothetical protein